MRVKIMYKNNEIEMVEASHINYKGTERRQAVNG